MMNPRNKLLDLTGQRFGIWLVVEQAPRRDNKTRWICECQVCGKRSSKRSVVLRKSLYLKCDGNHNEKLPSESLRKKPIGWAAGTERYNQYRATAKQIGFTFSLLREEFQFITQQNCHYCGAVPAQKAERRHYNGAFIHNGIDRKDSKRGYELDNCLPCCGTCNVMKQDLPYDVFLRHIALIRFYHPQYIVDPAGLPQMKLGSGMSSNHQEPNMEIQQTRATILKERCEGIVELQIKGMPEKQIAKKLRLSLSTIQRIKITEEYKEELARYDAPQGWLFDIHKN